MLSLSHHTARMSKLLQLPIELLAEIANHLVLTHYVDEHDYASWFYGPTDARTLMRLCLSSRVLRDVAQPVLHMHAKLPLGTDDPLRPLRRFLRTILQRPDLARSVKSLYLQTPDQVKDDNALDLSVLRTALLLTPDMCAGRPIPQFNILALAILSRLHNLECLTLTARLQHPRNFIRSVHRLRSRTPALPKMKSFHLNKVYDNGPVNLEDLFVFLDCPNFEAMDTYTEMGEWLLRDYPYAPRNYITRDKIVMRWALMDQSRMETLLSLYSSLSLFAFVMPPLSLVDTADVGLYSQFTPEDVVNTLQSLHGKTLEALHLDFHPYYRVTHRDVARNITGRISYKFYPPLWDFKQLKSLKIEYNRSRQFTNLPITLEGLELGRCFFPDLTAQSLMQLMHLKEASCPRIEQVIVWSRENEEEGIERVRELARSAGGQFSEASGRTVTFTGLGYCLQFESTHRLLHEPSYESSSEEDPEDSEDAEDL